MTYATQASRERFLARVQDIEDAWTRTRREIDEVIAASLTAYPQRHMTGVPFVPRPSTNPHADGATRPVLTTQRESIMRPDYSNPFASISPYPSLTTAPNRYKVHTAPDGTLGILDTSYDEFAALGRGTTPTYARVRALDLNGRVVPRSRYNWVAKHTLKAAPPRYTAETLVEVDRKVVVIRDTEHPDKVARYGMSTLSEVQVYADRLNRGLKARSSLGWTAPRPRFSAEKIGNTHVIADARNSDKVAPFGLYGDKVVADFATALNSGKRTTADFSWLPRSRYLPSFRDDKVKVGAKVRLTSTTDADYKVELKVGELVTKHGATVAVKADSKGHAFTAEAYTLEVTEEAPIELPTAPGLYTREGSLPRYGGGVEVFRLHADGAWYISGIGRGGLTRGLSPAAVRSHVGTAKLVKLVEEVAK